MLPSCQEETGVRLVLDDMVKKPYPFYDLYTWSILNVEAVKMTKPITIQEDHGMHYLSDSIYVIAAHYISDYCSI